MNFKPVAVEHVLNIKYDAATGQMKIGDNVPDQFKKLYSEILGIPQNGAAPATPVDDPKN